MDSAEISKVLAEANVARMRGELARAQDLLRQVLAAQADEPDALLMLGEVYADQGELDKALPYLDQAATARPHVRQIQEKRDALKKRIADREVANVVSQLGLPTTKSRAKVWAIGSAAFVFAVCLLSFFLGRMMDRGQKEVSVPITLTPVQQAKSAPPVTQEPEPQTDPVTPTKRDNGVTIIDFRPDEDKQLLSSLKSSMTEPESLTEARRDNRTGHIQITLRDANNADHKAMAGTAAAAVLRAMTDCPMVSVRVEVGSKLTYEADMARADWEALTAPDAVPSSALKNEWMSQS
ncbi:MAG: tetratricopeptide repeat protein [Chthonomonas sp.]|nr:tetratricopeptide repeat protein [Chthonomonas sp.]